MLPAGAYASTFNWNSGDFAPGVTAPHPLTTLDFLNIGAGGTKRFVGTTFTNQSLVRWLAEPLQGGNGAVVNNAGEWRSESDANSLTWNFGGQPLFVNSGRFSKTAGATTNVGDWLFRNDGGLIDAQVGTIRFNGGSNVFNAGSRFRGAGAVVIAGASTFNGSFQSDNLSISSGSVHGNAAALAGGAGLSAGLLGWSGGDLTGAWTLGAATSLSASTGATKRFVGTNFVNDGTFRWSTTDTLQNGSSSSFTNNGLTEVTQSAIFEWIFGGQPSFTNAASGTVRATNNATLTFGSLAVTSNGGLFDADTGSAIRFTGNTNRFSGGTRFVGDQRMQGTSRFVDTIHSDNLRFVSGTQNGGDGVSPGSRAQLAGLVSYEGGGLSGAWTIASGATMTGIGGTTKRLVGATVVNDGTLRWSTTDTLQNGSSSSVTNNGLTEVTQSATFEWIFGGQPAFTNAASSTVRATNNATFTIGSLALTSNGGRFEAYAGSAIRFIGGSNRFNDGTRFVGDQQVLGASRFVDTIHSDNLRFVSSTQTGGDGVTPGSRAHLVGLVNYEGGDLSGAWTIANGATMTGIGAATKRLVGANIVNDGTFRWSTTTTLQAGASASFTNNSLTEVTESASFEWIFGGQPAFTNAASGTVRATNNATFTIGSLALTSNGGLFEARPGAQINFAGNSNRFNDGTRFDGNIRISGSSRFVDQIDANGLRLVGGTQTGGDGSAGSVGRLGGSLAWEAGDLSGNFEIRNGATLTATTNGNKRQVGSQLVNNGTVVWASDSTLQGGSSSRLTNNGRFEIASDADIVWIFGG